jgi:hypothetical protein
MAFLTLFRIATGDNWNGIMKDTLREQCDSSDDCLRNCCISPYLSPLFFVVFVLMAQFVLVNVVVAVLMKHLEESHKQMEDDVEVELELEKQLNLAHEIFGLKPKEKAQATVPPASGNVSKSGSFKGISPGGSVRRAGGTNRPDTLEISRT